MSIDQQDVTSEDGTVTLSSEQVAAARAMAVDLGAPQAATEIDRPDGEPGYSERLAHAELLPGGPAVAAARHRLDKARENGAHPDEVDRLQRELADVAGYRLREHDQPLPTGDDDAPNIHELVVVDLLNRMQLGIKRYGQPLKPDNGRDALMDAYEEQLDGAAYLRQAIFERDAARAAAAAAGVEEIPPPPRTGRARVAITDGVAWLWNGDLREWIPLTPSTELTDEQRAAVEEHTGPLGPSAGAPRL